MRRMLARMTTRGRRAVALRTLTVLLVAAAPHIIVACGDNEPSDPSGGPDITGVVKTASASSTGSTVDAFLVAQGTGDYDKAAVAAVAATAWYRAGDDNVEPIEAPATYALTGKLVEVQFTGPVAESYPVQATAGWIIVHE
jgi:hypothetical protein